MTDNLLLVLTLGVILIVAAMLIFRLFSSMRSVSARTTILRKLAQDNNLQYKEGYGWATVSGMYKGRIINLSCSIKSGMTLLMATDNRSNNHLEIKSQGVPPIRFGDLDIQFLEGFIIESRSSEFADHLFNALALRLRMAPLATIPGLTISLSGMELTLSSPKLMHKIEDLEQTLDILSDLASAIEFVKQY